MAHNSAAPLPLLQDMFPALPDEILLATLEAHEGTLECAIVALLEMCAGDSAPKEVAATVHGQASVTSVPDNPRIASNGVPPTQMKAESPAPHIAAGCTAASADGNLRSSRQASTGQSNKGSAKGGQRRTWGQLRQEQQFAPGPLQPQSSPKYVAPGGVPRAQLNANEFPDLAPAGPQSERSLQPTSRLPHHDGASRLTHPALRASAASFQPSFQSGRSITAAPAVTGPRAAGPPSIDHAAGSQTVAPNPRRYARAARQAPKAIRNVSSWPRIAVAAAPTDTDGSGGAHGSSCGGYAGGDGAYAAAVAAGDAGGAAAGWQAAALEELCRSHAWAGRDLIEAVCQALQYDLGEVVSALDELHAASYQEGREGAEAGHRRGASASTSACAPSSNGVSSASAASSRCTSSASEDEDDRGGEHAFRDRAPAGAAVDADDFVAQAAAPASRVRSAAGSRRGRRGGVDEGGGGGDVYGRHRREALKLTHAWRKRMGRAQAAFASGDRSLGRALVAEAQTLRARAAAAHSEAAGRIEAEMNDGRQLSEWELDLHGLHAEEAVQALARRIAALEGPSAAAPHPHHRGRQGSGTSVAAPTIDVSGRTGGDASGAGPSSGRGGGGGAVPDMLALRRVLRVIVGKGLHSSGGEASLPRVVEAYLLGQGYRFTPRAGHMEVQLRRYPLGSATAKAAGPIAQPQPR